MKKLVFTSGLFLFFHSSEAQNKIIAQVTNFTNDKGVCRACLFDNEASFKGDGGSPFRCVQVPVKSKTTQAVFDNVPSGTYAIFVFHDVNSNSKLDTKLFGIPKEGYGASKNKLPFAAAPAFEDNKFSIKDNTVTRFTIKLRNL